MVHACRVIAVLSGDETIHERGRCRQSSRMQRQRRERKSEAEQQMVQGSCLVKERDSGKRNFEEMSAIEPQVLQKRAMSAAKQCRGQVCYRATFGSRNVDEWRMYSDLVAKGKKAVRSERTQEYWSSDTESPSWEDAPLYRDEEGDEVYQKKLHWSQRCDMGCKFCNNGCVKYDDHEDECRCRTCENKEARKRESQCSGTRKAQEQREGYAERERARERDAFENYKRKRQTIKRLD